MSPNPALFWCGMELRRADCLPASTTRNVCIVMILSAIGMMRADFEPGGLLERRTENPKQEEDLLRKMRSLVKGILYAIAIATPLCVDIPRGGVRRVTPQRRGRPGRESTTPALWHLLQCSTSAPIICSCSRVWNTEVVSYSSCKTTPPAGSTASMTSLNPN
jgi:hypothetical protein